MTKSHSEAYASAGVDITAGYKAVQLMKEHIAKTNIPGVLSDIGGFGGLFAPDLKNIEEPVFVSGTDGVGTKIRIAQLLDRHDTIGQDCVAMCVNDIVCSGARPLFFLDYIAIGKNDPEKVADIVKGKKERKKGNKKVLDHSANLRPRQLGSGGLGRLPPGAPNLTQRPRKSGLPGARF